MGYRNEDLNDIYDRTGGYCFYCDMRLSWMNYGKVGVRAAWEVDHFIPIRSNGAHQFYNLVPACVGCNTEKSSLLPWHYEPSRFSQGDRNPDNYL